MYAAALVTTVEIHVFLLDALRDSFQPGPVVAADPAVLVPDVVKILNLDPAAWL